MSFFIILTGTLFTLFSVIVLSYLSITTALGPWIGPTLILLGSLFFKARSQKITYHDLLLAQAIGAGGGAIATGIGFALPVLYFLDRYTFDCWLKDPLHFFLLMGFGCLAAGSLGIFLGRCFFASFNNKQELTFPVSQLTYQAATSQSRNKQTKMLFLGVWITLIIGLLRDGFLIFRGILPKSIILFEKICGPLFIVSLWPTLWSIGFTSGPGIIIPFLLGILSKHCIIQPMSTFFFHLKQDAFVFAFCSGLGLSELAMMIFSFIGQLRIWPLINTTEWFSCRERWIKKVKNFVHIYENASLECLFAVISTTVFFSYLGFSWIAQVVLLLFIVGATYEISYIGCKVGLIPFGRYSTFVLVPMLLLFNLSAVQITALCVFFNVCAAVASDLIFDYRTGIFSHINQKKLHQAQWIGLIIVALSIGVIFYILFTHFTLGSADFFAHRGQTKALLIQSLNFDFFVVGLGFFYGLILKRFKVSPTMVLGGIIMPNNLTIGLLIGSIISIFVPKKDDYMPFCSGVFASESLWVIITTIIKFWVN